MAGYNSMNGGYNPSKRIERSTIPYSIIPNQSSERYVATSAERIVEHVRPLGPLHDPQDVVTEFGYGYPAEAELVENYGVTSDKWGTPSAPHRRQVVVTDYEYGTPTKVEPVKDYGVTNEVPRQHYGYGAPTKVEPVKDYGVTKEVPRPSSLVLNRPPEVDSRPRRPGPLSATNWRNIPNSASQGGNTGYGEYTNDDSDDWKGQTLANKEGMERPSHKFGTAPPSRDSTPLSGPTNDIGKAMEILKEAAKPSPVTAAAASQQPQFNAPAPTVIDSNKAARKYGGLNLSSTYAIPDKRNLQRNHR